MESVTLRIIKLPVAPCIIESSYFMWVPWSKTLGHCPGLWARFYGSKLVRMCALCASQDCRNRVQRALPTGADTFY